MSVTKFLCPSTFDETRSNLIPGGTHINVNDIDMYVIDRGYGDALVFLHGLGWSRVMWREQIRHYGGRYRTIAADTRGHGESSKPSGPYSIALFLADWLALLRSLQVDRVVLVGFSQGGMIAMKLPSAMGMAVRGLVLIGTDCRDRLERHVHMEARIRDMRVCGHRYAARRTAANIFSRTSAAANPSAIDAIVSWRAAATEDALEAATRAAYEFDGRSELCAVTCPVLIIHGSQDSLVPSANVRETGDCVSDTEVVCIEGAGHMITIEKPAEVNQVLDRFLGHLDQ